jgi:hypothetical protein
MYKDPKKQKKATAKRYRLKKKAERDAEKPIFTMNIPCVPYHLIIKGGKVNG